MGISVARLRMGLVVGVALLAVVVGGFLGYARYRTHRFLAGLPGKLGINIRRETNGYTYSQSVGGKTVMTLHAAKAVERTDGKVVLHDVSMVLYGRKQDRADRISGAEFEYEQAAGVVRAVGEVHIDLQAPAAAAQHGASPQNGANAVGGSAEAEGQRIIHVKTSGLVYLQKLGVAATDQDLEFRFGEMTGHAKGAEYNSDTGVVILQTAVQANGLQRGTPVVLTAAHAELDRQTHLALLTDARYSTPAESARGDQATVHLRSDGSPERIEAEGNVVLARPGGGTVTAPHADLLLNATGQAQGAHLFGGVGYAESGSLREDHGEAQDARVVFDGAGHPERVGLTGAVHVSDRARVSAMGSAWSTRDAVAAQMTIALAGDPAGKRREVREVDATSGARLTLVSDVGLASQAKSELSADRLVGEFLGTGKTAQLSKVHGSGHTFLRRSGPQGAEQTSAGDTLEASLRAAAKQQRAGGVEQMERAVQAGHVTLTSRAAAKPGAKAPPLEKATAELAVYDGDADHLTLTGHAQVTGEQGTVAAGRIVLDHASGDATADGVVKATYVQASTTASAAAEPTHVVADHAELRHEAQRALFYGVANKPARLWRGGSQVEAPVLDLEQREERLTARGEASAGGAGAAPLPVHAVLVSSGGSDSGKAGQKARAPAVVRVASRTMVYQEAERRVEFEGEVKVEDTDGMLRARQVTAYLQPAPAAGGPAAVPGGAFGGGVERIVATGAVLVDQPGRRAAGERLVYTAADAMFVLTGTAAALPRLVDETQGTVTGQSLSFNSGDQSVLVTGGDGGKSNQRVHTVTRVKPQ